MFDGYDDKLWFDWKPAGNKRLSMEFFQIFKVSLTRWNKKFNWLHNLIPDVIYF